MRPQLGHWLFRHRGWIPLPLVVLSIVLAKPTPLVWLGLLVVALGEGIRLWGVAHIGARSRTRGVKVGALVTSGPFGISRNPLYIGNLWIWLGLGLVAGAPSLSVVSVVLMGLHYSLVIRWEESVLAREHGEVYAQYCGQVPRWASARWGSTAQSGAWGPAVRSERSTLLALVVVLGSIVGMASLAG